MHISSLQLGQLLAGQARLRYLLFYPRHILGILAEQAKYITLRGLAADIYADNFEIYKNEGNQVLDIL